MDTELFKLEIQDVKQCMGALQHRVHKLEELAERIRPLTATETFEPAACIDPQAAGVPFETKDVRRDHYMQQLAQSTPLHPDPNFTTPLPQETKIFGSFLQKQLEQRDLNSPSNRITPVSSIAPGNQRSQHESTDRPTSPSSPHPTAAAAKVIIQSEKRFAYDDGNDAKASNATKKEGLEVIIGKHLNKIGITFLVLGCALALIYQFQYFTPLLKILSGIFAAVGLIAAGEFFEKKPTYEWYGRSLTGGGWALIYFSIYAAYHFDAVKIINSAFLDFTLLLGVAAGAICHSLKYKSETITCVTLTLAFVTIAMCDISSFSLLACALLVTALAGIVLKMRWYNLMVYGESILYAVYLCSVLPRLMFGDNSIFGVHTADGNFLVAAGFSTFCWAAFNYVIFSAKYATTAQRNYVITATIINALAYVPTMLLLMQPTHADWRFGFLLASAAGYAMTAASAERSKLPAAVTVHTFIALTLVSLAIPFKLTGDWISAFWCIETPLLVWAGLRYEMPVMRQFAALLAAVSAGKLLLDSVSLLPVHPALNLVLGVTAVSAYALCSALYKPRQEKLNHEISNKTAFYSYFCLSVLFSLTTIASNVSSAWLPMAYVLDGTVMILLGFQLKDNVVRGTGLGIIFSIAAASYCESIDTASRVATAAIVPMLFYLADRYKKFVSSESKNQSRLAEYSLFAAATAVLTIFLNQLCRPFQLSSLIYACEGLAFLAYGLLSQDKRARIAAFGIFTLIAWRFGVHDAWITDPVTLFGTVVHRRLVFAIIDCAALSIASACYLLPRFRNVTGESFVVGFYSYGALLAAIAVGITLLEAPQPWLALLVSLECLVPIVLGMTIDSVKQLRNLGTLSLLISQFMYLISSLGRWDIYATIFLIALQFTLAFYYRTFIAEHRVTFEHGIEHCYGAAGTITLALLLMQIMPPHLLTIALTLEAISILTLGFRLQDRPFRMQGLLLLAAVIWRLLFVELASLATIYRIMSFIGAGIVLLLASFAYARLSSRNQQDNAIQIEQHDLSRCPTEI